jgi:hypothetical protein
MELEDIASVQEDEAEHPPPYRLAGLDQLAPEYVNVVHINYDPYAFHVAFARYTSPILVNDDDRQHFQHEGWIADVQSRLVIPPNAFRDLLRVMQGQVDQFENQFGAIPETQWGRSDERKTTDEA